MLKRNKSESKINEYKKLDNSFLQLTIQRHKNNKLIFSGNWINTYSRKMFIKV